MPVCTHTSPHTACVSWKPSPDSLGLRHGALQSEWWRLCSGLPPELSFPSCPVLCPRAPSQVSSPPAPRCLTRDSSPPDHTVGVHVLEKPRDHRHHHHHCCYLLAVHLSLGQASHTRTHTHLCAHAFTLTHQGHRAIFLVRGTSLGNHGGLALLSWTEVGVTSGRQCLLGKQPEDLSGGCHLALGTQVTTRSAWASPWHQEVGG